MTSQLPPPVSRCGRSRLGLFALALAVLTSGLGDAVQAEPLSPLDRGRQHHSRGELDSARTAYLEVLTDAAASNVDKAAAGTNLSLLLLATGDSAGAVEYGRQAVKLRRLLDDPLRLARTLNNLALALQRSGELDQARDSFTEAMSLNRRLGETESTTINLGNIAALEIVAGRYAAALDSLDEVTEIIAENKADWAVTQRAMTHLNRGVVLERLGDYRAALAELRLAAEDDRLPVDQLATLEINLGVALRHLGDPVEAIAAFQRAGVLYGKAADLSGLASAQLNKALALHLDLEQYDDAEKAYREALELAGESGDRAEEISALYYFGGFLADREQLDAAEASFERCLELAQSSGIAEGRWSALAGLGRIAELRDKRELAAVFLRRAVTEIETLRSDLEDRSFRNSYLLEQRPIYESTVRVFSALARSNSDSEWLERAFQVVQAAKARELSDALGRKADDPATIADLGSALQGRTLISYFVTDSELFRFVVADGELTMSSTKGWRELSEAIRSLRFSLSRRSTPSRPTIELLSQALLVNLDFSNHPEVIFAPDGALHGLPFEILEAESGTPLLTSTTVSYLPAASILTALVRHPRSSSSGTTAFANPRFDSGTSAVRRRFFADLTLPPLPMAGEELASISKYLDGPHQHFENEQATESTFRRSIALPSSVLHLATHAIADESRQDRTAVVLAQSADDDGLLYPAEIAALDIGADLTVLAACHTAADLDSLGGAHSSLVGSFLMAGSPAVIATLWDVGDTDSAAFMEQLYFQLGRGLRPADALRETKLRLRQNPEWSDTGIWAAFVLVGHGQPVQSSAHFEVAALIALGLALLTSLFVLSSRRRSKTVVD